MVNPGSFSGQRKAFLDAQKEAYAAAVTANHVNDAVADIQRRYFKRFPITLAHSEEPTEEHLATVDDDAPDPELVPPRDEGMVPEAYARAKRVYEFQCNELAMRKAQIKRRLHYEYTKVQSQRRKFEVGSSDPMAVLTAKLTGSTATRPRLRTAYNLWGPSNRCFVDPVFQERVRDGSVPARQQAALRSAIYKEMFEELPENEQREWAEKAEREHREALEKVSGPLKAGPSTAPQDRQRIIECLSQFMEPILDLLADHTGWKISLIAGGPEPADGGRLGMLSVHSGTTTGPVKMTFGRSERVAFKEFIMPTFARFLKKCYTIQECRDRALPEGSEFVGLAGIEEHDGVEVHRIEDNRSIEEADYVRTAAPRPKLSTASNLNHSAISTGHWMTKSATKASRTLPPIKFGPPRNGTKPTGTNSSPTDGPSPPSTSHAVLEKPINSPLGSSGAPSRGPTPPTSRAQTPAATPPIGGGVAASAPPASMHSAVPTELVEQRAVTPGVSCTVPAEPPLSSLAVVKAAEQCASTAAFAPPNVRSNTVAPQLSLCARSASPAEVPMPQATANPIAHEANASSSEQDIAMVPPQTDHTTSSAGNVPSGAGNAPTAAGSATSTTLQPNTCDVLNATDKSPIDATDSARNHCTPPTSAAAALEPNAHVSSTLPPGSASVPDMQELEAAEFQKKTRKRKQTAPSMGPHSKKRKADGQFAASSALSSRTASAASSQGSNTTLVDAPNAPDWVVTALQVLRSTALGSEWDALLSNWINFEQASGFQDGARLGAKNRPRTVTKWIQYARKPTFRAEINNLGSFSTEFTAWWTSLQPDWRTNSDSAVLLRDGEDWECLRCPGVNGLLSVVAALFFWGCAVQKLPADVGTAWSEAVDDVSYSIAQLL